MIDHEDIHKIARHSNADAGQLRQLLTTHVYQTKKGWQKFLNLLLITLGVGLTVSGILFFFAYNWEDLPAFAKLGLTQLLLIITTVAALSNRLSETIKNIVLTGGAMLVGVLFAVFGQIYQTGANAYDFFLAWTLFIMLWTLVSNFAPLWLLFITLINTTFVLYTQQVARDWDPIFILTLLFVFNTLAVILSLTVPKYLKKNPVPNWFTYLLALAAVSFSTMGISYGIVETATTSFNVLIILSSGLFTLGLRHGYLTKNLFYPAVIALSIIIIASVSLVKISDGAGSFLLVCLFVIISISAVIKVLLDLKKKWDHEN